MDLYKNTLKIGENTSNNYNMELSHTPPTHPPPNPEQKNHSFVASRKASLIIFMPKNLNISLGHLMNSQYRV